MNKPIQTIKNFWQSPYRWPILIIITVVFLIGLSLGESRNTNDSKRNLTPKDHTDSSQAKENKEQIWTCSMHPQIRQPKPGKCPICFMDLVPVQTGGEDELGPRQLKLTATAMKLANIRTAPVVRQFGSTEIRMVGKVFYDETRLKNITARVPGRIDRLYVDYTGIPVRKGDHLVSLYSPELITAQQELLQAIKSYKKFNTGGSLVEAARDKLKLWGLTPRQIREIEKKENPSDHLTIYSPTTGIVIEKKAIEGAYVKTGTPFYTIADLSHLWIKLDAYESDLVWLRYGQTVKFETEAFPGEFFSGRIAFIDPVLNPKTRTVKVRVNIDNPKKKLKPEMFVRAVVHSKLSADGKVIDPELAGKWISPMHPEIVKDKPGTCDICGMPLVKAESLGFAPPSTEQLEASLLIPASAPLITGTRAIVYTTVPGKEGTFEGKEITLGPRTGNYYVVKQGLEEGEDVVVNGAFKIDSDLQIQAKPSMMSLKEETPKLNHQHPSSPNTENHKQMQSHEKKEKKESGNHIPSDFKKSIDAIANTYFRIQQALSSDNLEDARKGAKSFLNKLATVDMELLRGEIHMEWMKQEKALQDAAAKLEQAHDIETARTQFEALTKPMTATIKTFSSGDKPVYRFHCPMAFDNKGAYWLQNNDKTRNPYFGASMLLCKDSVEKLETRKK